MNRTTSTPSANDLEGAVDRMLGEVYPDNEPGAAVLVASAGRVVYRKAFGRANLELDVPMQADFSFRIGSITKQFTAVALLLLVDQGKLALADDISRFLPDYPTHGHRIRIEHLLTHTSGIKSYTDRPDIRDIWRRDVTVAELISEFKDLPMEFAPGERMSYSNSGYCLLGAIIEAASGQTYEEFLQQSIFQPLRLEHTSYDHPEQIVAGRAVGYDYGPNGFQNAAFLSMSQPYAAGALRSTVDDLALWDEALSGGRLVPPTLLERAWTAFQLSDGSSTGYGYGWGIGSYAGHRLIHHGGGIPGFLTYALRLPDDRVFVAVLTNRLGKGSGPRPLALKIGALAIGQPYEEPEPITLGADVLERYAGVYQVRSSEKRTVLREGDTLFMQWGSGPKREILPWSESEFYVKDDSFTRLRFVSDRGERATSVEIYGLGPIEMAVRVGS